MAAPPASRFGTTGAMIEGARTRRDKAQTTKARAAARGHPRPSVVPEGGPQPAMCRKARCRGESRPARVAVPPMPATPPSPLPRRLPLAYTHPQPKKEGNWPMRRVVVTGSGIVSAVGSDQLPVVVPVPGVSIPVPAPVPVVISGSSSGGRS